MPEVAAARAVLVKCGNLVIATIKPTIAKEYGHVRTFRPGQAGNVSTITYVHSLLYANRDPYVK